MRLKPFPKFILLAIAVVGLWYLAPMVVVGINGRIEATPAPHAALYPQVFATVEGDRRTISTIGHSDGDAALLAQRLTDQAEETTGSPALDKTLRYAWAHAGALLLLAVFITAMIIASGNNEDDSTKLPDDPEYVAGFSQDYHGDDAFEVPAGMNSQYESVPVRKARAAGK